jgi:hypothetical protein
MICSIVFPLWYCPDWIIITLSFDGNVRRIRFLMLFKQKKVVVQGSRSEPR